MCVSATLRPVPAGTWSLVGLTLPDWSRGRDQANNRPWSSRLGVGRWANHLSP